MINTEPQMLDTTQLRCGDIVRNHGMRVLLDQPPTAHDRPGGGSVVRFDGRVLNPDLVRDDALLWSFLHTDEWNDRLHKWERVYTGRFAIQGNELARWSVESRCGSRAAGMHPDARCLAHGDWCAPVLPSAVSA